MKLKKNKYILLIIFSFILLFLLFKPSVVNAGIFDGVFGEDTEDIVEFLKGHSDWLQYASFLNIMLHEIGWLFVKGLYVLTSFLEELVPESLSLLSFLEDAGLNGIATAIVNDLVVVLMVLTLVFLGFKMIIAKEPPSFKNVGVNIFISAFLIIGLPSLMTTMEDISLKFYDATQTGNNNGNVSSLAWGLVQDNTADLFYAADNGFDLIANDAGNTVKNALTPELFKSVNLTEVVTTDVVDDLDTASNDVTSLKYTLSNDGQGNYKAVEIESSMISWFSDSFEAGYFRYPVKFFPIMFGLLALSVAYLFTLFVFVTTIIEIGIKRIVAMFVFATDLETGQRTKVVMKDILNAFMLIGFTGLNLKLYTLFLSYVSTQDVNITIYIIAMIAATFVLIKGSSTIMRYFGVDVGVKDGLGQLAAAFAVGKTLSNIGGNRKPKTNGENAGSNGSNDQLDQLGEDNNKSINDSNDKSTSNKKSMGNALKNSVNSANKNADMPKLNKFNSMNGTATEDNQESNVSQPHSKSINSEEGLNAQYKALKLSEEGTGHKISNKQDGMNENGRQGLSDHEMQQTQANKTGSHRANANNDLKTNESNSSTIHDNNTGKNNKSNEEILADIKLNDAMQSKNLDANGNVNMQARTNDNAAFKDNIVNSEEGGNSNKEILANIKQNDAIQPNNANATGNINMKTQSEQNPFKNQGTVQQNVASDMKVNSTENRSSVSGIDQKAVQRVMQQVENTSFNNPETAKQSVIQAIQQGSFSSNEMKQKVIQEVESSSRATPEQLQQNVQQVLSSSGLPNNTQESIQKVIQEIQQSGDNATETVRGKVIQEIEKASLGDEKIKQKVVQEVEKAFNATPEQMQQNIKQTITETKKSTPDSQQHETKSKVVEEKVTKSKGESKYFGSLLGSDMVTKSLSTNQNSRFSKFNKG